MDFRRWISILVTGVVVSTLTLTALISACSVAPPRPNLGNSPADLGDTPPAENKISDTADLESTLTKARSEELQMIPQDEVSATFLSQPFSPSTNR